MQSSGSAAVRQWPTLSFTHWTCKFDLTSEFIRLEMEMGPPPPLYKLRPCPSYSRDRINLGPNFNLVPNVVQPHKTWVS